MCRHDCQMQAQQTAVNAIRQEPTTGHTIKGDILRQSGNKLWVANEWDDQRVEEVQTGATVQEKVPSMGDALFQSSFPAPHKTNLKT